MSSRTILGACCHRAEHMLVLHTCTASWANQPVWMPGLLRSIAMHACNTCARKAMPCFDNCMLRSVHALVYCPMTHTLWRAWNLRHNKAVGVTGLRPLWCQDD